MCKDLSQLQTAFAKNDIKTYLDAGAAAVGEAMATAISMSADAAADEVLKAASTLLAAAQATFPVYVAFGDFKKKLVRLQQSRANDAAARAISEVLSQFPGTSDADFTGWCDTLAKATVIKTEGIDIDATKAGTVFDA